LPWYNRAKAAIHAAAPFLVPIQATNLALLVSAILKKQTLCLSELARAYPTPQQRWVKAPKHDLLVSAPIFACQVGGYPPVALP
jgi:hypothetical protein